MTCCAVDVFHLDLGPAEADLIVGGWELAGVEVLNQNFRGVASRYSERRGSGTGQEGNDTDLDRRRRDGLLRGRDGERRQRQGGCEAERVSAFPTAMCHWSVPLIGCRQSVCAATTIVRYFFPIVQTSAIVQPRKSTHNRGAYIAWKTSQSRHLLCSLPS